MPGLGATLVRLRDTFGLSQRELAALSGVSHAAIRNLERGRSKNPTLKTYARLARGLTVKLIAIEPIVEIDGLQRKAERAVHLQLLTASIEEE